MPKLTGYFNIPSIDIASLSKTFQKKMSVALREATRNYLKEVILHVPVYTGMARGGIKFARGTQGTLGAFLRVSIPISPRTTKPRPLSKKYRHFYPNGRSPQSGGDQSTFVFEDGPTRYTFQMNINIFHFHINNFYDVSGSIHLIDPVPWAAIESGLKEFNFQVKSGAKKAFPKIRPFVKVTQLKFR